jgi:hypothetical protein
MIAELAARHALPREIVDNVAARTGGVPLFVEVTAIVVLLSNSRFRVSGQAPAKQPGGKFDWPVLGWGTLLVKSDGHERANAHGHLDAHSTGPNRSPPPRQQNAVSPSIPTTTKPPSYSTPTSIFAPAIGLYRFFDANGVLIHVGISRSAILRLYEHAPTAAWFERAVRVDIEKCRSKREASLKERQAILDEKPLFNRAHVDHYVPGTLPLTDRFYARIKPIEGKRMFYWDTEEPGFGLKAAATGHKSFVFQYRVRGRKGRERRVKIDFSLGLDTARKWVKAMREDIRRSVDKRDRTAAGRQSIGNMA